jgi:uncharacterized membrane protein YidH (DUF202 family)
VTANIKTNSHCSTFRGNLVMIAAIAAIVAMFTILDVQISLARIDPSDSTTWAHLARPQVAYFFIPVLAALVAAAAVIVNFIVGLVLRRRFSRALHWAILGVAYALVSVAQPVSAIGLNHSFVLWLSATAAVLSGVFVRWRYGVPKTSAAL